MTKINNRRDCGNSPKNKLVQDLTIAFARAEASRIAELTTIDVRWLPVGRKPVEVLSCTGGARLTKGGSVSE